MMVVRRQDDQSNGHWMSGTSAHCSFTRSLSSLMDKLLIDSHYLPVLLWSILVLSLVGCCCWCWCTISMQWQFIYYVISITIYTHQLRSTLSLHCLSSCHCQTAFVNILLFHSFSFFLQTLSWSPMIPTHCTTWFLKVRACFVFLIVTH